MPAKVVLNFQILLNLTVIIDITFHFSHQIRSVFHARIKELLQVVTSSQNFSEYVKQLLASMIDIIGSGKQDWAEWRLNFVRLQVS